MTKSNKSIKVIKRRQRDRLAAQQEIPEYESKTDRQSRREMFNTITSWIDEQRETKKELQQRDCLLLRNATTNTA